MRLRNIKIQGWHEPQGLGHGWMPCSDRQATRFFVYGRDGIRLAREFKTRAEAEAWVATLTEEQQYGGTRRAK